MPKNSKVKHTQGYGLAKKNPSLPKVGISNYLRNAWFKRTVCKTCK